MSARTAWAAARPAAADALLWTVLMAAGVFWYADQARSSLVTALLLPALVLAVAVPGSRKRPGGAVFLVNGLCALGLASPGTPANAYLLSLAVLSFLLATRSADTGAALWVFGGCMAVDLGLCGVLRVGAVHWFYAVTLLPAAMVLPWLTGRYWHARQALVHGGWQRAHSLERQQGHVAEQARLRERTRIAAEMHDSLGHELSLIGLRAGALELSPTLSGQDREDLAELRGMVSDAVDHLRDAIGVLRDGPEAERAPEPVPTHGAVAASVESLEQLVGRVRESGVAVELSRDGADVFPPLVDRAVYRVVQESLTNAIKHAPGSAVLVRVTRDGGWTTVRVTNTASQSAAASTVGPGRHGLAGLRERALMLGGTLRAAPSADGFEVLAALPDRAPAERPRVTEPAPEHSASASVSGLASAARRRARLRFTIAFGLPAGFGLVTLVSAALLGYQLSTCVLRPADFATLKVGAEREGYEAVLPPQPFRYPPDHMRAEPAPSGSTCEFYRSNINLLEQVDLYRLCWSDGRLVAKDVVPGEPSAA
ncbi:sensor histidine kinase [Streptomyces sp. NPDC001700]